MNKYLKVVLSVAIVIALGGAYFYPPQVLVPGQDPQPQFGAVSGPDVTYECTSQNGVEVCKYSRRLSTATTTPCILRAPTHASSTLVAGSATLGITTASSTASTWVAAKSSLPFATTTQLASFSVGSGALASLVVTATTTSTETATVYAPGSYLVWSRQGSVESDTTKWNGMCEAAFQTII